MYRKHLLTVSLVVLILTLVGNASACSFASKATSTPLSESSNPIPTATMRIASVTPPPSPTQTNPTSTLTARATWTPTPTSAPEFLLLPDGWLQPTPLFTPAFPVTPNAIIFTDDPTLFNTPSVGNYQLKEWSEADGLALIRLMNQTAYDMDIPSAGDFRDSFLTYQRAVNRAAREFLLRYPNSVDREQVEWLLAFTNTLDRRDSDEWLVAQINQRINKGWLNPADLNSGLEPLGFVAYPAPVGEERFLSGEERPLKPVLNLFGDQAPVYIWEIQNTEENYYSHKIYLAVEQLSDGSFRVERIYSKHNFPFSGGARLEVHDLTGDGQPELIISDVGCEFGCNTLNVYIYQWQVDRFVELSHGNFGSEVDSSGGDFTWEYDDSNQNASTVINVTHSAILEPDIHHKLIWNGEWFQIAETQMVLPVFDFVTSDRYESWIGFAMEYGEFDGIQPLFEYLLENPPEGQGSAFPDFIRFQMAMVEALNSGVGPAREQLQTIVDSPTDPAKPLVAAAAAAFLENYQGDIDIYRSCQAALLVMDHNLKSLSNANSQPSTDAILDSWGFLPVNSLCNPRAAFRLLLSSLSLESGADVTDRLRQAGVPVARSLKADFDGDGLEDWLVIVDTPASERTAEAWVIVDNGFGYSAIPVFNYDTRFPGYAIGTSNRPVRAEIFPLPGTHPAILLQAGQYLAFFTVHHKSLTTEVELLFSINQVQSFQIDPQASIFQATFLPGSYYGHNNLYIWREGLERFLCVSQVDILLFEQGNTAEAIRAINLELSSLDKESYDYPVNASRLYYMLGLAYELQGNSSAAVETYLKVWQEYPESPYAIMAREKIQ